MTSACNDLFRRLTHMLKLEYYVCGLVCNMKPYGRGKGDENISEASDYSQTPNFNADGPS